MSNICVTIKELVNYAVARRMIEDCDRTYATNCLLSTLGLSEYNDAGESPAERPLEQILADLCEYAVEKKLIENDSVVYRDL